MTEHSSPDTRPDFRFERDTLAFPNELMWAYSIDAISGRTQFTRRHPKATYAHRCFVLCRVARQFHLHASFHPQTARLQEQDYRRLLKQILSRGTRTASPVGTKVSFPGYGGLREFSSAHEALMKAECGGAWRSYFLRSHWRMVFPITREHQQETVVRLMDAIAATGSAVVHLVTFPRLSINHGMVLYSTTVQPDQISFAAYDPNDHRSPTSLVFRIPSRRFQLGANAYWRGGNVNVIQIYRNWFI